MSPQLYAYQGISNLEECRLHQKYKSTFNKITCGESYHHYQAKSFVDKEAPQNLKIAGFNLWNIGSGQTKFKNFDVVSKIMNQWDIVAAIELLPIMGEDLAININLLNFLNNDLRDASSEVTYYKRKVEKHRKKHETKPAGSNKSFYYKRAERILAERKIFHAKLQAKEKKVKESIRAAGYYNILRKLQVRNPEAGWSLLLSNEKMGDSSLKELAGFFYKKSIVKPFKNEYCSELKSKSLYACLPVFLEGNEKSFARKPFIVNFKSGNFDFTLLTTHIRFNPPKGSWFSRIKDAFSSRDVRGSKVNLARLEEVLLIGKLMNNIRLTHKEKDLFLIGDLNLSTKLITKALSNFSDIAGVEGWKVLNDELTSISDHSGRKSNYDHVVYHNQETSECNSNGDLKINTFDFTDETTHKFLDIEKYNVFREGTFFEQEARQLAASFIGTKKDLLIIKKGDLLPQYNEVKLLDLEELFYQRVLVSQTAEMTTYKWNKQLISDHLPISFACSTLTDDD